MFTTLLVVFVAGMICQYLLAKFVWPRKHRVYTWMFGMRNHRDIGEPCETDMVLDREGYSLGYSFKWKCALWASYIISKHSIGVDVPRNNNFYADPEIPPKYRVFPDDFTNSGFDKGHLVPSASVDFSRKSNRQTFSMSNVVFQHPKLNRQAWGYLESRIRKWTASKGKLAIVTGPLYGKRNKRINDLAIPRQFFKVVYSYDEERCIGFLLPNKEVENKQLWKHAVSVKELESETGYSFFTGLSVPDNIKESLEIEYWEDERLA